MSRVASSKTLLVTRTLQHACSVRSPASRPAWSGRTFSTSAWAWEKVQVPQMAESISEGTLKQWLKQKGDYVEADEEVATIETDKIDVSVNAPFAGTITEHFAAEEDTVSVGQDLFDIKEGGQPSPKAEAAPKDEPEAPKPAEEDSPSKRKKAEEVKIEKKEETPARPEPQHTQPKQPAAKAKESPKNEQPEKAVAGSRNERRVKMPAIRKRISERLKQSQNTAAFLTTFNEIDMSALMQLRARYKDRILKEKGVKLGFMSAFAKASALALQEFPVINASIEGPGAGEQFCYHDYVDLSIAVATPKGLVTPVVRNVENLSFLEVEQAIADLGKKARDGKLTLEDMAGGTFTISNGGVFGSLFGTPIINLPQSAVLGMHSIKDKAWVVNGKIEIRPIMVVALTYDHRIMDGSTPVQFLVRVKEMIEDPGFFLLQ